MRRLVAIAAATIALGAPARAGAATVTYCGFGIPAGLTLNGSASAASGTLALTPNLPAQAGSAFYATPLSLAVGASLHTYFRLSIGPDFVGGDGMTFVLQSSPSGASALGTTGEGLGYQGIAPSLAVDFDTSQSATDPTWNYVGLVQGGDRSTHLAWASPVFLASGQPTDVWVDYDGAVKKLSVFVTQGGTAKPSSPAFVYTIDLVAALGTQLYAGFTAATGVVMNSHVVQTWELSTDGIPCGCQGIGVCYQAGLPPICGASNTCVECAKESDCAWQGLHCDTAAGKCVFCVTSADCSAYQYGPYCDPSTNVCRNCHADSECTNPARPACQPAGDCAQCSATNDAACKPSLMCEPYSGTCVGCLTSLDCPASQPVCQANSACGPCTSDDDCIASQGLLACVTTGPKAGTCGDCTADSYCYGDTPKCDLSSYKCVGCATSADCSGTTPLCDPSTKLCVGCFDASTCPATSPVCWSQAHACTPCGTDYSSTNPLPLGCQDPAKPACASPSSPLYGQCLECSAKNATRCGGDRPTCDAASGACGCTDDATCPAATVCDRTVVASGTCVSGCHAIAGFDTCSGGQVCSKQDGTAGVCEGALDAGADVASDQAAEAAPDAAADASADVTADAAIDSAGDATQEDAGPSADAPADAAPDATPADASADGAPAKDAGADAGTGAGADAGETADPYGAAASDEKGGCSCRLERAGAPGAYEPWLAAIVAAVALRRRGNRRRRRAD